MKITSKNDKLDINNLKKMIIELSYEAKEGHIASCFSCLDSIFILYKYFLKENDRFILSKGHAALALYVVLYYNDIISKAELFSYCTKNSKFGGHPAICKQSGIYASTGSLGHGLPISIGMCLANTIKNLSKNKIFCLIGDGECNEGTIWESLMIANNLSLSNLIILIDNNYSQTRSLPLIDIGAKLNSFGISSFFAKGNDIEDVYKKLNLMSTYFGEQPKCLILNTKKGNGIKEIENNFFAWHHRVPLLKEKEGFIAELDQYEKSISKTSI